MDDPLKFKARAKMFQNIGVQGFDACIYGCLQLLITAKVFYLDFLIVKGIFTIKKPRTFVNECHHSKNSRRTICRCQTISTGK